MPAVMDAYERRFASLPDGGASLGASSVGVDTFRPLHSAFLGHAARAPACPALTLGKRTISYGEMDRLARLWAGVLTRCAGARPARVGVFASRSEVSYIGVLAALYAGAGFVPLNRKFPVERTRSMVLRADLDVILADVESARQLPMILAGLPKVPSVVLPGGGAAASGASLGVPVVGPDELEVAAPLQELPRVAPDDLAYLLFTSGSTGAPKGVPVLQRNVRAFLDVNRARYDFGPEDRFSQTFDQTFDLSVFDLFMAWECGASVCVPQPLEVLAPLRFIQTQGVTVWFSVPSVVAGLLKRGSLAPGSLPDLRWSLFCGEGLPREAAERWQAAAPRSTVENLYGPTELTIACSAYRWRGAASLGECVQDLVPIGDPYPGLVPLVVDGGLEEVPDGEPGELCIAGPQTFPGYWRAPELDDARFFERRGEDGRTHRFYRTGDLVVRRACGYVYLGRNDQQVKIGGHRVELGEVEAAFRKAGCVQVTALGWPDAARPEGIVVAISAGSDPAGVTAHVQQQLPAYMMPRVVRVVDPMPLNANGKVDRAALRETLVELLRVVDPDEEPTQPRPDGWAGAQLS